MCKGEGLSVSAVTVASPAGQSWAFLRDLPTVQQSSARHAGGLTEIPWPTEFRVLVTASRRWKDPERMWRWLDGQHSEAMDAGYRYVTVIHGDASGGDQIAKLWGQITTAARQHAVPADWSAPCRETCAVGHRRLRHSRHSYCPAAGMYRNQEMVDMAPHIVGAFIQDNSSGATGCARIAREAGIKVEDFYA